MNVHTSCSFFTAFIADHNVTRCGIRLWSPWVNSPGCFSLPTSCPPQPTHWRGQGGKKEKSSMLCKHCSATGKHWCVINTALVSNPKHSSIQIPTKKITFPARFSQLLTCLESVNWLLGLDHNTVRTVFQFSTT